MKARMEVLRVYGAALAPLSAFLLLQGLETLHVRMERHVQNAHRVAEFLAAHPRVAWVNWPGLPTSPYHALARRTLRSVPCGPAAVPGAGGVMTFGILGDAAAGARFIDALQVHSQLANIGDAKSLVIHPASTTHRQLSETALRAAGVTPDMIRLSVGIESIRDILWDLDQALVRSA
jgi:O-acetylhomoserine (thiol)-lyase